LIAVAKPGPAATVPPSQVASFAPCEAAAERLRAVVLHRYGSARERGVA